LEISLQFVVNLLLFFAMLCNASEVLAQLDEVALVGYQAKLDIGEKKKFFTWKLLKIDDEVGHFEERTAAAHKETEAAQAQLDAVRAARAENRERFEEEMAQLEVDLVAAKAKNTSLYTKQLNILQAGRKERQIQAGVTEANAEKLLALAVQKNRAIKQLHEQNIDRQKAVRKLADMKERCATEQQMTALFQAELQGLEDEYTNLSKKVREYVAEAKKAKEKKETEASVLSPGAGSTTVHLAIPQAV
jgi:septal ring factor EnvC (AmiA/AmiB activator)